MQSIFSDLTPPVHPYEETLMKIRHSAARLSVWLRTLAVFFMLGGALLAFTGIGLIIAWLPIISGIVLWQAATRAYRAQYSEDVKDLLTLMGKLRIYFILTVSAVLFIFAMGIMFIFTFNRFFHELPAGMSAINLF